MSSGSNTKYSWMSDAEFLRVAQGVIGLEVLEEALHRLSFKSTEYMDRIDELEQDNELLGAEVYRLESVIDEMEASSEYA
jgi:hypothetical protein